MEFKGIDGFGPAIGSETKRCCAPARPSGEPAPGHAAAKRMLGNDIPGSMVTVPAGEFLMGDDGPETVPGDGEGPVRRVRLEAFLIDAYAVSNSRFAAFVDATGYITESEHFGWSYVFAGFLPPETRDSLARPYGTPWWCAVPQATWRHPEGPGSSIEGRQEHPVVHVSWNDANAFCAWAGLRLPTESEWEHAARGGLDRRQFPWGDNLLDQSGRPRCNIWPGEFPVLDPATGEHYGTMPVDSFEPNGFGLHNTVGNVWEWCADNFSVRHPAAELLTDPHGPASGTDRVIRGGSYLCHASYCNRYRVSARSRNTPDSSTGNTGFRCARSLTPEGGLSNR